MNYLNKEMTHSYAVFILPKRYEYNKSTLLYLGHCMPAGFNFC